MAVLYSHYFKKDTYATDYCNRFIRFVATRFSFILYPRWVYSCFAGYSRHHSISASHTRKKAIDTITKLKNLLLSHAHAESSLSCIKRWAHFKNYSTALTQ